MASSTSYKPGFSHVTKSLISNRSSAPSSTIMTMAEDRLPDVKSVKVFTSQMTVHLTYTPFPQSVSEPLAFFEDFFRFFFR